MLNCHLCQEESVTNGESFQQETNFANLDELEAHLASEHFNCLPYVCEQCQFAKFPTEFAIMKHNEQDHGNKQYSFRCRITPEIKKKREKVRESLDLVVKAQQEQHGPVQTQFQTRPSNGGNEKSVKEKQKSTKDLATVIIKNELVEAEQPTNTNTISSSKKKSSIGKTSNSNAREQEVGNGNIVGNEFATSTSTTASLMEQIQAACSQNIRRNPNNKTATLEGVGATMEIKEGAELPANFLESDGGQQDDTGRDEDEEDQQQVNVQEILKAAAAATSKLNTSGSDTGSAKNSRYSLRPNRFSPYTLLHNKEEQNRSGSSTAGRFTSPSIPFKARIEKAVERIRCRKCKELVNSTGGCLMHHLNTRHLRFPLFQCTICRKDFYEVSNTRVLKHMRHHHGGDTSKMVSNYAQFSHALHAGRDECFGNREERLRAIRMERIRPTKKRFEIPNAGAIPAIHGGANANGNPANSAKDTCEAVRAILQQASQQQQSMEEFSPQSSSHSMQHSIDQTFSQQHEHDYMQGGKYDDGLNAGSNIFDEIGDNSMDSHQQQLHREDGGHDAREEEYDVEVMEEEEGQADMPSNEATKAIEELFKLTNGKGASTSQQHLWNWPAQKTATTSNTTNGKPKTYNFPPQMMGMLGGGGGGQQHGQVMNMQMQLGSEEKIPCKICGELVLNKMLNRLNHVNVRHLHLPLHQCRLCQKSFPSYSRSACYSHVQFAHRAELESGQCSQNIEEHIIYMKDQYHDQLIEAAKEYFE